MGWNCNAFVLLATSKDPITGMIEKKTAWGRNQYKDWNKENSCVHFKRKFFARKEEKIYCKNCKFWEYFDL